MKYVRISYLLCWPLLLPWDDLNKYATLSCVVYPEIFQCNFWSTTGEHSVISEYVFKLILCIVLRLYKWFSVRLCRNSTCQIREGFNYCLWRKNEIVFIFIFNRKCYPVLVKRKLNSVDWEKTTETCKTFSLPRRQQI